MYQADAAFKQVVEDHFSFGHSLYFNENVLAACALGENRKIYQKLGKFVTTVILDGVSQENAKLLFSHFKFIRDLTLQKVHFIGEDMRGYPMRLERMQILESTFQEGQIKKWFKRISHTLISIQVSQSRVNLHMGESGSIVPHLRLLPNVAHISINDEGYLRLDTKSRALTRLEVVCKNVLVLDNVPALKYLSYDAPLSFSYVDPAQSFMCQLECKDTLRWLMLRQCPYDYEVLLEFKNLNYLRIIESVEPEVILTLQSLEHLRELDVHCYLPPEEENLILDTLNEDCWLHIFSYLTQKDWISVSRTHTTLQRIICQYTIPRNAIRVNDEFLSQYPLHELWSVYAMVGAHAKSLTFKSTHNRSWERVIPHFTRLTDLLIHGRKSMGRDHLALIPNGLHKLRLVTSKQHSYKKLFQRLNPTLTSLEITGQFDPTDLTELHNLREFLWEGYERDVVNLTLGQNTDLERLVLNLTRGAKGDVHFTIPPLKKLREVRLYFHMDIRAEDFPSLEEIYVSFVTMRKVIAMVTSFPNLKTLFINTYETWNIRDLHSMKNLKKLEIDGNKVDEDGILYVVKSMPKLEHLKTQNHCYSKELEMDLDQLLGKENRRLYLYSAKGHRKTFVH